jgi:hypothetical protein
MHDLRPRKPSYFSQGRWIDHPEIFGRKGSRRSVYFVSHPYEQRLFAEPEWRSDLICFCAARELVAFIYGATESWYNPHGTRLIVAVPRLECERYVAIERERCKAFVQIDPRPVIAIRGLQ